MSLGLRPAALAPAGEGGGDDNGDEYRALMSLKKATQTDENFQKAVLVVAAALLRLRGLVDGEMFRQVVSLLAADAENPNHVAGCDIHTGPPRYPAAPPGVAPPNPYSAVPTAEEEK